MEKPNPVRVVNAADLRQPKAKLGSSSTAVGTHSAQKWQCGWRSQTRASTDRNLDHIRITWTTRFLYVACKHNQNAQIPPPTRPPPLNPWALSPPVSVSLPPSFDLTHGLHGNLSCTCAESHLALPLTLTQLVTCTLCHADENTFTWSVWVSSSHTHNRHDSPVTLLHWWSRVCQTSLSFPVKYSIFSQTYCGFEVRNNSVDWTEALSWFLWQLWTHTEPTSCESFHAAPIRLRTQQLTNAFHSLQPLFLHVFTYLTQQCWLIM